MLHDLHPVRTLLFATALLGLSACRGGGEAPVEEPPVETPPAPAITSIVPAPVPATTAAQTLTIRGANFVNGAIVHTAAPGGSLKLAPANTVEFVSATELRHEFRSNAEAGTWQLRVTNPDSQSSAVQAFAVAPPAGLPSITSVSPSPMPGLADLQTLTITGSNFDDGAALEIRNPAGATQSFSEEQFTRVSATELRYELNNLNFGGSWQVRVINGDGASTGFSSFIVEKTRSVSIIQPGPNATTEMLEAAVAALPGATIEFACGFFDLSATLLLTHTEDVVIRGCGVDGTVLSFRNNTTSPEGILADNVRGLVVEDLTVADSHGNGIELRSVEHATIQRVRTFWSSGGGAQSDDAISADNFEDGRLNVACTKPPIKDPDVDENQNPDETTSPDYTPSKVAGRYGVYPVKSRHILVTETESIGASDAGIYVGQSSNAIIENSRAVYNVFGFEIENVQGGEYRNNLAECNTGGFLVYDLDNLTQYGSRTRMYNNVSRNNNTYNFSAGGIVSQIPPGSGMITLAYDQIDVFNNEFTNNDTAGIIHVSYAIFPDSLRPNDNKIDFYTEGLHIFGNTFTNNGNNLQPPSSRDIEEENVARVLPALVGSKVQAACGDPRNAGECPVDSTGGFRGAHIIFDGLVDDYHADCAYPTDGNGNEIPKDERGKPEYNESHPQPDCYYNAYKFHVIQEGTPRKLPEWFFSCIDADNTFADDSVTFANFNGTKGANAAIALATGGSPSPEHLAELEEFPASFDLTPHRCDDTYGSNMPLLPPVVIPEFVPSGDFPVAPTPEEVAALCDIDLTPGEVNFDAFRVDCLELSDYNLFADPEDPRSTPNSGGVPFVLNSKLFSDYSLKYRVLFLPPGSKAVYRDGGGNDGNTAIAFPVGTIIAKTFAFNNDGAEDSLETRLLIKRTTPSGSVRWAGTTYIWEDDGEGGKIARLAPIGTRANVSWDYEDPETGKTHSGSTDSYLVPTQSQCQSCHANLDGDPGAAPIGLKVRNLNRGYRSESPAASDQAGHSSINQIQYWCENGILQGCPSDLGVDPNTQIAANLEYVPKFNVPGSSGFDPDSPEDTEARARAWLEVNCQHCHNPKGFAANTGFYLDVFRAVDTSYGICKGPTATGAEGSGGRAVDIHPGSAAASILEFRISPAATSAAARMPPLARSVVDTEAHDLIRDWINDVVKADESKYPGSTQCASN